MRFTVDRKRWNCGHRFGASLLLNDHGQMCCLGFVSKQLGFPEAAIHRRTNPEEVPADKTLYIEARLMTPPMRLHNHRSFSSSLTYSAMAINDLPRQQVTSREREKQLQVLFSAYGHELTFTGRY